jgi:hypothetical protein
MGYVDKNDHMTNTFFISRQTWPLDLILNNYVLLCSCGSKLSHRDFGQGLVWDLSEVGGRVPGTKNTSLGMPTLSTSQLEAKHVLHWLETRIQWRCHVFHEKKAE